MLPIPPFLQEPEKSVGDTFLEPQSINQDLMLFQAAGSRKRTLVLIPGG